MGVDGLAGLIEKAEALGGEFLQMDYGAIAAGRLGRCFMIWWSVTYEDGWREGSWAGFSEKFVAPAPWCFRTVESWMGVSGRSGFGIVEVQEPRYPQGGKVASLILVSRVWGGDVRYDVKYSDSEYFGSLQ